jgi:N-acetylglucosaminyldiphosphoundecaprenol N-acetyl-beta-D-mannosaminyltransferase
MLTSQEGKLEFINVCGVKIDMVQMPQVIDTMEKWIAQRSGSKSEYIVVSNAYDLVTNSKNDRIKKAANNSSFTIPDGTPLIWLGRLHGYILKRRVYGPDLMFEFLKLSEVKGYSHFFYGSSPKILDLLVNNLRKKFPSLNIAGSYSPPFRKLSEEEEKEVIDSINKACPDILWVGLGTPKQQLWMYDYKDRVKVPVMAGVGAAFDFFARTTPHAPRWIRDNGFEWLFRFLVEPRRLWKRYLVGNTIFIWIFLKEFIKVRRKLKVKTQKSK